MNQNYINLENKEDLIEGIVMRKLILHKDESGLLVETLRKDWQDIFDENDSSFFMQYISKTPSGLARDEDKWHAHKKQKDRFVCISGRIVTAVYDPRENSKTKGKLNLFLMGPEDEKEMYALVIPEETLHGFMVISKEEGILLNFPTQLYNPEDEGRFDNTQLSWDEVRKDFNL